MPESAYDSEQAKFQRQEFDKRVAKRDEFITPLKAVAIDLSTKFSAYVNAVTGDRSSPSDWDTVEKKQYESAWVQSMLKLEQAGIRGLGHFCDCYIDREAFLLALFDAIDELEADDSGAAKLPQKTHEELADWLREVERQKEKRAELIATLERMLEELNAKKEKYIEECADNTLGHSKAILSEFEILFDNTLAKLLNRGFLEFEYVKGNADVKVFMERIQTVIDELKSGERDIDDII